MSSISHCLTLLCAGSTGLFAGAMLTELFVLVPWWRSLQAEDFFAWYAANDRRLLSFFGPVTAGATLLAIVAALAAFAADQHGKWCSASAAALLLVTVAMFRVYFEAANRSFATASISSAELPSHLASWAAWHGARTILSLAALGFALAAQSPSR